MDAYHSYGVVFLANNFPLKKHLEVLIYNVILALMMSGHYVFFLPIASLVASEFGYIHNVLETERSAISVDYARIGRS